MKLNCQTWIFPFVALVTVSNRASGQGLEAKFAGARLPYTLYESSAVYDGVDNVYLFGGLDYEHQQDFLKIIPSQFIS
jgi:hypothetical protein